MTRTSTTRNRGAAFRWAAVGAGALAAATLFNRAAARRAEVKYPPIGDIIHVDGVDLHVVDTAKTDLGRVAGAKPSSFSTATLRSSRITSSAASSIS